MDKCSLVLLIFFGFKIVNDFNGAFLCLGATLCEVLCVINEPEVLQLYSSAAVMRMLLCKRCSVWCVMRIQLCEVCCSTPRALYCEIPLLITKCVL
jgi:hypothetical protein